MQHFYQTIPGWFDFEDVYRDTARALPDGATVVEVGCWKGRSTAFLAVELVNSGKRFRLVAVDHFRGSPDEPHHLEEVRAVGGSVRGVFEDNLRRGGVLDLVEVLELPSVEAAARFPRNSIDFFFLDAAHDYAAVTADLRAWLPKVKWGGTAAGHDYRSPWPGVHLAVRDFIPLSEILEAGGSWVWRKTAVDRGHWRVPPPVGPLDFTLFIPYVNRPDLLTRTLDAVREYHDRVVVVDQSDEGVELTVPTFRWRSPRHFARVQNWIAREAQRRSIRWPCFLHSDAIAGPGAVAQLIDTAGRLDRDDIPWGVLFTNYDALCAFSPRCWEEVGCWDETFSWYVGDVDYYDRVRWAGLECPNVSGVVVEHLGSQTLAALSQEERAATDADHCWARAHYQHKWGRPVGSAGPRFATPYNGNPW